MGRTLQRSIVAAVLASSLALGCGDDGGVASDGGTGPGPDAPQGAGGDGGGGAACIDGLEAISLDPADSQVTLDGSTPDPVSFTPTGELASDSRELDPSALSWTANREDDTPPGTIAEGVYEPNPEAGGVVTIAATDGCVTGETTIDLGVDVTLGEPTDPEDWSGDPDTGEGAPAIVYPSDQTRFPRNIYRTQFQWRAPDASEFRLVFSGSAGTITVYTDGAHADCAEAQDAGCWEAGEEAWSFIAGSHAGEEVSWTVDALDPSTDPPTIRRSQPITIGFSKRDVRGAIFYWSTTSEGIRRAHVSAAEPEDYITGKPSTVYSGDPEDDEVECVACHVVSRDGKYMAAPVKAKSGEGLWIMEVAENAPPPPLVKNVADTRGHGFATFSPDNEYVGASWDGDLWVVDRASGDYVEDVPIGDLEATQPDWSPDNSQVVFATAKGDGGKEASLAVVPFDGIGNWGAPEILVSGDEATNLFPMFSPEGDWIAFARGGDGNHGDERSQLHLVGKSGDNMVELENANRVVSNQVTDGLHQNNAPTWAPAGDLHWIAFNSQREYGVVLEEGTQQIWVAAIDPAELATGEDPSFPAFRLQFQGLEEDNHRAFWTLDVREPPPPDPDAPDAGVPADAGICVDNGEACEPEGAPCCDPSSSCRVVDGGYLCGQVIIE